MDEMARTAVPTEMPADPTEMPAEVAEGIVYTARDAPMCVIMPIV